VVNEAFAMDNLREKYAEVIQRYLAGDSSSLACGELRGCDEALMKNVVFSSTWDSSNCNQSLGVLARLEAMMDLHKSIQIIEKALERAPGCTVGLLGQKRVFGVQKGPSGGPEILAALCLDYDFFEFYYGHILQHPQNASKYVSLLICTKNFINASDIDSLFKLFHCRTRECRDSQMCTIQCENDAYAEADCLESAASALEHMIINFDIKKRSLFDDAFDCSTAEFRTLEICGFKFDWLEQDDSNACDPGSSCMESKKE